MSPPPDRFAFAPVEPIDEEQLAGDLTAWVMSHEVERVEAEKRKREATTPSSPSPSR